MSLPRFSLSIYVLETKILLNIGHELSIHTSIGSKSLIGLELYSHLNSPYRISHLELAIGQNNMDHMYAIRALSQSKIWNLLYTYLNVQDNT